VPIFQGDRRNVGFGLAALVTESVPELVTLNRPETPRAAFEAARRFSWPPIVGKKVPTSWRANVGANLSRDRG
jgi:hypothetical protein